MDLGECKMIKNSADRPANAVDPATPENKQQATERRRLQDALEDDEVYEALKSLHKGNRSDDELPRSQTDRPKRL
jgi:hypothetical protein